MFVPLHTVAITGQPGLQFCPQTLRSGVHSRVPWPPIPLHTSICKTITAGRVTSLKSLLYAANQQLVDSEAAVPIWFNTNHHTVGPRLPYPQLRILCQVAGCDPPERGSRAHEYTSLFRIHPVGAPEVLDNILGIDCPAASGVIAGSRALPSVALDSWLDIRIPIYPAGTHKLSIFRSAMAVLAEDGIAAFCKAWRHCAAANQAAAAIAAAPDTFHIGAHYLTGNARDNTQDAALQNCEPLYGRVLRTRLPTHPDSLQPASVTRSGLGSEKGQSDSGKALRRLLLGETVRVQNPKSLRWDESATVVRTTGLGRSYHVQTAQETVFWRNRKFLRPVDFAQ